MVRKFPRLQAFPSNGDALKRFLGRVIVPAIVLIGAAVRLYRIGNDSLWYDELYTIWASKLPLGSLLREVPASGHPPLYYLASHVWLMFGSSEAWVRMISWAAGVAAILLVYLVGKELFSRRVGVWGAAFAAFSPILAWYSQDATDYSTMITMSLASLYFLVRSLQRGGWINWTVYVAITTGALFSHFSAIFLFPAEVPVFLLLHGLNGKRMWPWISSQVTLGLLTIPWLIYDWPATAFMGFNGPSIWDIINGVATAPIVFAKGYAGMLGSGSGALSIVNNQRPILAIAFFSIALLSLTHSFRTAFLTRKSIALMAFTFVLIAGPVVLQELRGELIAGRFYSMAAPTYMLMGAFIITSAPTRITILAGSVVLAAMAVLTIWGLWWTGNDDWRDLMATVQTNKLQGDELLCFPIHHCVVAQDFYLKEAVPVRGGAGQSGGYVYLWPRDHTWGGYQDGTVPNRYADNDLQSGLDETVSGASRIWLVCGSGEIGNYNRVSMVEKALSADWELKGRWNFSPLLLELYQRKTEEVVLAPH